MARAVATFAEGLAVLKASPGHLLVIFGQSLLVWLSIASASGGTTAPSGSTCRSIRRSSWWRSSPSEWPCPTPGAVGGFHEFYLLALTQAFGVDKHTAAAAGIACHALTNLPVLVLGLALLGREGLTMGKVADMAETPPDGRRSRAWPPSKRRGRA